ncbi:MAG: hypothetical protein KDE22_11690 [Rhodobacterales bacterium]|nr:hypothetical protein [Rhodobacterales bacterium]
MRITIATVLTVAFTVGLAAQSLACDFHGKAHSVMLPTQQSVADTSSTVVVVPGKGG